MNLEKARIRFGFLGKAQIWVRFSEKLEPGTSIGRTLSCVQISALSRYFGRIQIRLILKARIRIGFLQKLGNGLGFGKSSNPNFPRGSNLV